MGVVVVVVPTFDVVCDDRPELSVVGADRFDEVLCEVKSLPPLTLVTTPVVPVEPPEAPVTVFEHLKHFGSHD